jgi:hypothetical protein
MAAAALVLSMLDDKPVLILAPATLIWQWQEELEDKLGVPAAVWSTQKKCWLDGERRPLTQKGDPTLVAKCPWRIGIMSTGLIVNGDDAGERGALAKKSFGVVILDEAHKARASRGQNGRGAAEPNQLLRFLRGAAGRATNVIIGTATPIQLDAVELWDLLNALPTGASSSPSPREAAVSRARLASRKSPEARPFPRGPARSASGDPAPLPQGPGRHAHRNHPSRSATAWMSSQSGSHCSSCVQTYGR